MSWSFVLKFKLQEGGFDGFQLQRVFHQPRTVETGPAGSRWNETTTGTPCHDLKSAAAFPIGWL